LENRLKLESEVVDKEEDWEIFDLKKTSLDNVFYLAYGAYCTREAVSLSSGSMLSQEQYHSLIL